jgi:hypothetical protein
MRIDDAHHCADNVLNGVPSVSGGVGGERQCDDLGGGGST